MITRLTADQIYENFIRSGIQLNPPASETALYELRDFVGFNLSESVKSIYSNFDGFANLDFDKLSHISIWPIKDIINWPHVGDRKLTPFADFSVKSHIYICSLYCEDSPVINQDTNSVVSLSFMDFISDMALGEFDF